MNPATMRVLYAAVILVGAFLSFEIQPLVGKMVTAGFGGSAAIWGVCLLYFQAILLCGYTLTYLWPDLLRADKVLSTCVCCTGLGCLFKPARTPAGWGADTQGDVAQTLLLMLASHLAFPA